MKLRVPEKLPHPAFGLIGIGATVLGVAFTLNPPSEIDQAVFWSVLMLGGLAIVGGIAMLAADRLRSESAVTNEEDHDRRLLAAECQRVSDSLSDFLAEWKRAKPRVLPLGNGRARLRNWHEEGERRYRERFRPWALGVFDAAVELDGVLVESRIFVETPGHEHLHRLPGLFRDAAQQLDPA
jgi:hypothetical protein